MVSTRSSNSGSSSEDKHSSSPSSKRQKVENGNSVKKSKETESSKNSASSASPACSVNVRKEKAQASESVCKGRKSFVKNDTPKKSCFSYWTEYSSQFKNFCTLLPLYGLISESPENPSESIRKPAFLIGSDRRCDLLTENEAISEILCVIRYIQGEEGRVAIIETIGRMGSKDPTVLKEAICTSNRLDSTHDCTEDDVEDPIAVLARLKDLDSDAAELKEKIRSSILEGQESNVSFDAFPYFLSEITKKMLIAAAYIHLKCKEFTEYTSGFPTLSPRILLSGPAGTDIYQEMLSKALANQFEAKLLIFDSQSYLGHGLVRRAPPSAGQVNMHSPGEESSPFLSSPPHKRQFRKGDRVRYVGPVVASKTQDTPPSKIYKGQYKGRGDGLMGEILFTFKGSSHPPRAGIRFDKPIRDGTNLGGLCEEKHGFLCDVSELQLEPSSAKKSNTLNTLFEVVANESRTSPIILFLKDFEKFIYENPELYSVFKKTFRELTNQVLIIASHTQNDSLKEKSPPGSLLIKDRRSNRATLFNLVIPGSSSKAQDKVMEGSEATGALDEFFLNKVTILMPQEESALANWRNQLDQDVEALKEKESLDNLCKVLEDNELELDEPYKLRMKDHILTNESAEKVVGWALSHYFMQNPEVGNAKIALTSRNIQYGVQLLQNTQSEPKSLKNSLKDVVTDNEFEKRVLDSVTSPSDIGVTFDEIGALEKVKDTLKEFVMLPLQRPELFTKGQLTKPCKGILLFGPPGTGKTMLAKAVATDAGANFINISMSSISSKYFGECEKYVKAIFSLASKIAPSVIFIDEVDSMLGMRENSREHEASRKMKNEFMTNWEGLCTKENERVLVLAATNRPFDIDEGVLRRFTRRLMVDLPDAPNRSKILKVILAKEDLSSDVDLDAIASWTNGYSGSDLKNLCIVAAHRPIKEIIEKEKKEKQRAIEEGKPHPVPSENIQIRSLQMEDFKYAHGQVCASVSSESVNTIKLSEWNNRHGEGGSGKRKYFSYYS